MIGKTVLRPTTSTRLFSGLVSYITRSGNTEKVEFVSTRNVLDEQTAIQEMEALAVACPRCKDPVMHLILSWRQDEIPSSENAHEAVSIVLNEFNLQDNQVVYALHTDTNHHHVHIAVNRVHPETERPVNPANGWTKNAMEIACRKIEYQQGWEIEQTGRFRVIDNGEVVQIDHHQSVPAIDSRARDSEAREGVESVQRMLQRVAKTTIEKSTSWEQLHAALATSGIEYQAKGSGAVFIVKDVAVKASNVARNATLSKLQKRLGPFLEIENHTTTQPKFQTENSNYRGIRQASKQDKRAKLLSLRQYHFRSDKELHKKHKQERYELIGSLNWTGKGHERNALSSALAEIQRTERYRLKKHHKTQIQLFHQRHQVVPDFVKWKQLNDVVNDTDQNRNFSVFTGSSQSDIQEASISSNIVEKGFSPKKTDEGLLWFHHFNQTTYAVAEYADAIHVRDCGDNQALYLALKRSSDRWGSIQVNGMDEQGLRLVARQAVRYGFNIQNEEVKTLITEYKNELLAKKLKDKPLIHSDFKTENRRSLKKTERSKEPGNDFGL